MSDKIVNLAPARTAREFLDKYGDLPVSALSLVAAIAGVHEACGKSIQAVEERLGETPRANQTVRQVVALAAQKGDAEAKLLLESGALEIMTTKSKIPPA
jgi:predicted transcriptional regulator